MLRDGPALAIPDRDGETGSATRPWRKGILVSDLMIAFGVNVAGVIARRGYSILSQPGAPTFLAWVGAPQGKSKARARWRGYGEPARDEDAKGQWRHTRVTLASMWFPSSKTCNVCGTINPKLQRERVWTCPSCGTRHDRNLNAAINLRNLIMPSGRSRNGRGQEVVVLQQRDLQRPRDREPGNGAGCAPGVAAGITGS